MAAGMGFNSLLLLLSDTSDLPVLTLLYLTLGTLPYLSNRNRGQIRTNQKYSPFICQATPKSQNPNDKSLLLSFRSQFTCSPKCLNQNTAGLIKAI